MSDPIKALRRSAEPSLADMIAANIGSQNDARQKSAFAKLSAGISEAERFVFDAQAFDACDRLSLSKPSSILEATKFCRLPFKNIWVEWNTPLSTSSRPLVGESWSHTAVMKPAKLGFLAQGMDDSGKVFGVTLAWSFSVNDLAAFAAAKHGTVITGRDLGKRIPPPVEISAIGFIVNWYNEWPLVLSKSGIPEPHIKDDGRAIFSEEYERRYGNSELERKAAVTLNGQRVPTVCPSMRDFYDSLAARGGYYSRETMLTAAEQDWEGEYQRIIAMLCLLNSKTCVSTEAADLSKVNRARKIRGRKPLISYSTVSINLSRQDAKRAADGGADATEIRRHIVRGHFKIRKGGVFWWRPFLRGDASIGEVRRSGYVVTDIHRRPSA